jgi:Tol biopolymer transport system component
MTLSPPVSGYCVHRFPIRLSVAALTTALVTFTLTTAQAADLSFVTAAGLFRIESDRGDRQALLHGEDLAVNALAWSPDGQRLAVVHNYGDVYRVDLEAETIQRIFASDCSRSPSIDLAWQISGDTLVINYRCPGAPGVLDQWRVYLSSPAGDLTSVAALPEALESDVFLAPDGRRAAYVTNQHIFVDRLDGTPPLQITQTPGIYGAAGSPLAWSPDGTRLAFYEGRYPFQRLNVVRADGGDRRLLTPDPDFQIYRSRLLWSPNGRYIAFYRPHNPPFSNQEVIALVNVNTSETQVLTRPGFYDALSWAPDSQHLVLAAGQQSGQQALFNLNLVTQEFTVLSPQLVQNVLASQWSPTGDWIAFTAAPLGDPFGTQVLYRVRPDGRDLTALTGTNEYVYPFSWVSTPARRQMTQGQ